MLFNSAVVKACSELVNAWITEQIRDKIKNCERNNIITDFSKIVATLYLHYEYKMYFFLSSPASCRTKDNQKLTQNTVQQKSTVKALFLKTDQMQLNKYIHMDCLFPGDFHK